MITKTSLYLQFPKTAKLGNEFGPRVAGHARPVLSLALQLHFTLNLQTKKTVLLRYRQKLLFMLFHGRIFEGLDSCRLWIACSGVFRALSSHLSSTSLITVLLYAALPDSWNRLCLSLNGCCIKRKCPRTAASCIFITSTIEARRGN